MLLQANKEIFQQKYHEIWMKTAMAAPVRWVMRATERRGSSAEVQLEEMPGIKQETKRC